MPGLLGGVAVGGDEELAFILVVEEQEAVQAEVVDDHAERQVSAGAFIAERDRALEAIALDFHLEHDRLAGRDRKFERAAR